MRLAATKTEVSVLDRASHCGVCVAGPTAVGKSDVALVLAECLGGEIVSVDSMQVYVGLDIGTAKPSVKERQRVRHHLIDIAALDETYDAAKFVHLAARAVGEICSRGKVPIFCGGTGLYLKGLLAGLGTAPSPNPALRAELEATPLPQLLSELEHSDPLAFRTIDQSNPRRVVRAIEVRRLSGKSFLEQRSGWSSSSAIDGASAWCEAHGQPLFACGLTRKREDLWRRIDERVELMFQRGLVDETRALLDLGLAANRTAMQAIGYRQVVEYLQGQRLLPETIALVKQRTRLFAKRQLTWFRRQLPLHWIHLDPEADAKQVAEQIMIQYIAAAEAAKMTV